MPSLAPPKKISLEPRTHHAWTALIFVCGFILPPLAVAVRFGIGSDFFINCFLCICGYFPSHFHNFYVQNIRNNTGKNRTPKWAKKYGLVDDTEDIRRAKKSEWAHRYNERNPDSTLRNAELADGEEGENYEPVGEEDREAAERRRREGLWERGEEEYYNPDESTRAPNQKNWHYPANFEGTDADEGDRWERTRAARDSSGISKIKKSKNSKKTRADFAAYAPQGSSYGDTGYNGGGGSGGGDPLNATYDDDVPEWGKDYGASKKSSKKSKGRSDTVGSYGSAGGGGGYGNGSSSGNGNGYANAGNGNGNGNAAGGGRKVEEDWNHQF